MTQDAAPLPAPPTAICDFSAVLLAGGKSSRMGRDKAGITVDGELLWRRQLATLRCLRPRELFISGRPDGPYAKAEEEILVDLTPGCGPLSGLEAAFVRATSPLVLVLAIDLPAMTTAFLSVLVQKAGAGSVGVVPLSERWFEPLAAIYPRTSLPLLQERLRSDDRSMQTFVKHALARQFVVSRRLTTDELPLFRNANTSADLRGG